MTYDIFLIIVYFYFAQKFVQVHIKFNDRLIEIGILHHERSCVWCARANFKYPRTEINTLYERLLVAFRVLIKTWLSDKTCVKLERMVYTTKLFSAIDHFTESRKFDEIAILTLLCPNCTYPFDQLIFFLQNHNFELILFVCFLLPHIWFFCAVPNWQKIIVNWFHKCTGKQSENTNRDCTLN